MATQATLESAVATLLAKHRNDDRYATYHAAEVEAWKNWEKCNKDQTEQGVSWRAVAEEIADQYHAPNCPWLDEKHQERAVKEAAVAAGAE